MKTRSTARTAHTISNTDHTHSHIQYPPTAWPTASNPIPNPWRRLVSGRAELEQLESARTVLRRELEIAKSDLEETLTVSGMEHKNLKAVRARLDSAKGELQQVLRQYQHSTNTAPSHLTKLSQYKSNKSTNNSSTNNSSTNKSSISKSSISQ